MSIKLKKIEIEMIFLYLTNKQFEIFENFFFSYGTKSLKSDRIYLQFLSDTFFNEPIIVDIRINVETPTSASADVE